MHYFNLKMHGHKSYILSQNARFIAGLQLLPRSAEGACSLAVLPQTLYMNLAGTGGNDHTEEGAVGQLRTYSNVWPLTF